MAEESRITVEATLNAPVELVWKLWNSPEDIMKWNTPDPSWHCPSSENDLKAGGNFKNRMEAKDGSYGFDFAGIYERVVLHKEITYTMADGRHVTTIFGDHQGNTQLATTFDPETENDPEFQKQGWQSILDNFKKYAESK